MYKANPCERCPDHSPPCHGKCDEHKVWLAEYNERQKLIKQNKREAYEVDRYIRTTHYRLVAMRGSGNVDM